MKDLTTLSGFLTRDHLLLSVCVSVAVCLAAVRSDLARQYRSKMSEIDLQRTEQARLQTEYETKLRKKEVNTQRSSDGLVQ